MTRCVKWGVAGASKISEDFVTAMSMLPEGENKPCAIAARSLEKAQQFAEKMNVPKAYGSYEEMAKDPEIEIVYVGTIHPTHRDVTKIMLEAGKNVLSEKPLTVNLKHTKEVIALAKKKNLFLMEGFWSRFFPVYQDLKAELKKGEQSVIGTPQYVNVSFGFPGITWGVERLMDRKQGGGTVLDVGCYTVQFSRLIFNEKPQKIVASGVLHETGVDSHTSITLYYSGNRQAQLNTSLLWFHESCARVTGTEGMLEIPKFWCPTQMITSRGPKDFSDEIVKVPRDFPLPDTKGKKFNFMNSEGFTYEIKAVREALLAGKKEHPFMTHEDSIANAEILDEIRRQIGVVYDEDK